MPEQYEFADSTDWLPTPLAALAPLESSLRCQVCKDFFTTPMMTSCSHTFCSLCIRRYLSQEGRCPACRESDQEVKLRRNWVLEELVANFTASRKGLLAFARSAAEKQEEDDAVEARRPKKRRKVEGNASNGVERRSTRSQSKRMTSGGSQPSMPPTPEVIEDSEEGSVYEDIEELKTPRGAHGAREPNDGRVACPCCHRRMKENLINSHLDKCILGDSHTPVEDSSSPAPPHLAPPGTIAYTQKKPSKQNERLPFINYSLLTDNALRKKLRDLGIPNHGSKELMRRRHTEWVNLWNANCDSTNPVTKRQLLQELRVWEDTLGRQGDKAGTAGFMAKDFDRDNYVKNQKTNFDDLIKQAREKRAAASSQPSPATNGETPVSPQREAALPQQELRHRDLTHLHNGSLQLGPRSEEHNTSILASVQDSARQTHTDGTRGFEQQPQSEPSKSVLLDSQSDHKSSRLSAGISADPSALQSYAGDDPGVGFNAYAL